MEAFVYCWTNHTKGHKYVGYHKGTQDDGYICSSSSNRFWADWKTDEWSRQIIAEGTVEDCIDLEYAILKSIDLYSDEWYNNSRSKSRGIVFTGEVRQKMKNRKQELYASMTKDEIKAIQYNNPNIGSLAKKNNSNVECPKCGVIGQYRVMKKWHFENCGRETPELLNGDYECPHCKKKGKNFPAMKRHHFDNCRNK